MKQEKISKTLSKHEKEFVKHYISLNDIHGKEAKYIAFVKSGCRGDQQDCDCLFNLPHIQEEIKKNIPNNKMIIKKFRKSKLTEELMCRIEKCLITGLPITSACEVCGIRNETFHRWKRKGSDDIEKDKKTPYAYFVQRYKNAYAKAEAHLLQGLYDIEKGIIPAEVRTTYDGAGNIVKKSETQKNFQVTAYRLERLFPIKYNKQITHY